MGSIARSLLYPVVFQHAQLCFRLDPFRSHGKPQPVGEFVNDCHGSILRTANNFIRQQEAGGKRVDLYVSGKKGVSFFNFQKRPITQRYDLAGDVPRFGDVERIANDFMNQFTSGKIDSVHVAYMNFISTSTQRPEVLTLLPLAGVEQAVNRIMKEVAEEEAQAKAGALDTRRSGTEASIASPAEAGPQVIYDFSPAPRELLDELLPLTVKTALFQCFLDAATSENVARMVAMARCPTGASIERCQDGWPDVRMIGPHAIDKAAVFHTRSRHRQPCSHASNIAPC